LDITATVEVRRIAEKYRSGTPHSYKVIFFELNKDFSSFKNNLSKHCTKDYIFQIDADEYPHTYLLQNLSELLELNKTIDVYLVPRINTVEGLTQKHIIEWGWRVDEKDRVNFPDFQWRIWKNKDSIYWINKVHERLSGFSEYTALPELDEFCLYHPKHIKRQEVQNQLYKNIS
jgi:glycosyltransferase involved in cell wall biosynthesis